MLISSDAVLIERIRSWLDPWGWSCPQINPGSPIDPAIAGSAALVLLDGRSESADLQALVQQARALPGKASSLPLFYHADQAGTGANAWVPVPLEREAFLALVEEWAGSVEDTDFRRLNAPRYMLTRLAGRERAEAMLGRFVQSLIKALAAADGNGEPVSAHHVAGLAGVMGYTDLGKAWADVDADGASAFPRARVMSLQVLEELRSVVAVPC